MTLSVTALSITALSITMISIMTLGITALSIKNFDSQHSGSIMTALKHHNDSVIAAL
jgi:hypothetical protein